MMQRIQKLPRPARVLVFFSFFAGIPILIFCGVLYLVLEPFTTRTEAESLIDGVAVGEFVALPDDDAYPASVAVAPDGTVYTASYATGAVWSISADGETITELPDTRSTFGAVAGLGVASDGAVYVADRLNSTPGEGGGVVWRINTDSTIDRVVSVADAPGQATFHDLALDGADNIYVVDRIGQVVWRILADSDEATIWWRPPTVEGVEVYEPTGLAYDTMNDAMLITDASVDAVYRVPVDAADTATATEIVYRHRDDLAPLGLAGLTMTPDGVLYVAALSQSSVAQLDGEHIIYLATGFRGASDIAYHPSGHLYVTNWDQTTLLNLVGGLVGPRLPFALDVITLNGD